MKKGDSLGDRMKGYESTAKNKLLRRTPVIIRLDGKAFHTWTKKLPQYDSQLKKDPWSIIMHHTMLATMQELCYAIQNAVFAYTQSDEISILLNDWKTLTTDQWFDGSIQKMASVSASMATGFFNVFFNHYASKEGFNLKDLAFFDSRVFNVPREDVANYFVWRQQDATRNSVQMLARFYFLHKQLHKKNGSQIQDMLMLEKGVNWNDIETWKKRGSCIVNNDIDLEIPIFTKDREYIERCLREEENDADSN